MMRARLERAVAQVKDGYFRHVSPSPHPRDLRASDADRERVVRVLAEAMADGRLTADEHAERVNRAYSARMLGELAVLTEDLLAPSAQPLRLDDSRSVAALFGTQRREGRWIVPERLTITAVGGQVVLDLREAVLQGMHSVFITTLLGGTLHMVVPEGVGVVVTGGRGTTAGRRARPVPGQPVIEVRAVRVAGRIRIHTPRRGRAWWRR